SFSSSCTTTLSAKKKGNFCSCSCGSLFHNSRSIIKQKPLKLRPHLLPFSFFSIPLCRGSLGHTGLTTGYLAWSSSCNQFSWNNKSLLATTTYLASELCIPWFARSL